jgi:hypothetical protein
LGVVLTLLSINGHLHYPNDLDRSLNEVAADKIRGYHTDYNNRPSNDISFMSVIVRIEDLPLPSHDVLLTPRHLWFLNHTLNHQCIRGV